MVYFRDLYKGSFFKGEEILLSQKERERGEKKKKNIYPTGCYDFFKVVASCIFQYI